MPLMPADVSAVAFSKPPLGKRGYDEDEVDAFLDQPTGLDFQSSVIERHDRMVDIADRNDVTPFLIGRIAFRSATLITSAGFKLSRNVEIDSSASSSCDISAAPLVIELRTDSAISGPP